MNTGLSKKTELAMSPGWKFVCGVILVGAALHEVGLRAAPLLKVLRRPTMVGGLVAGAMVRDAVERLGEEI